MASSKNKRNPAHRMRSAARRRALQALYQWQMAGQDLKDIETQFSEEMDMSEVDVDLFHELLHGVPSELDELDAQILPHLDRTLDQLDPIEKAVLRIGVFELNRRLDVPVRVVINEAVELAKQFGAEKSHTYINGVLDKVARGNRFRKAEMNG